MDILEVDSICGEKQLGGKVRPIVTLFVVAAVIAGCGDDHDSKSKGAAKRGKVDRKGGKKAADTKKPKKIVPKKSDPRAKVNAFLKRQGLAGFKCPDGAKFSEDKGELRTVWRCRKGGKEHGPQLRLEGDAVVFHYIVNNGVVGSTHSWRTDGSNKRVVGRRFVGDPPTSTQLHGKTAKYDIQGKPERVTYYKNGKRHGLESVYKNGKLMVLICRLDGKQIWQRSGYTFNPARPLTAEQSRRSCP